MCIFIAAWDLRGGPLVSEDEGSSLTLRPRNRGLFQRLHIPGPEVQGLRSPRRWGQRASDCFRLWLLTLGVTFTASPRPHLSPSFFPIPGITLSLQEYCL